VIKHKPALENWLAYVFESTSHKLVNPAKRYCGEFSGIFYFFGNLREKGEDAGCGEQKSKVGYHFYKRPLSSCFLPVSSYQIHT
jgi:hypothetical protein